MIKPDDDEHDQEAGGYVYRFSPQYYFTPDAQVYALVAHGYKGPLIDASTNDFNKILPEQVQALETGLKSQWFDHRLTANVDVFQNKFTNLQTSSLVCDPATNLCVFQLTNAPGQKSKGAELEMRGKITDNLNVNFGMTVLDARFTSFKAPCWNSSTVNGVLILQSTTVGQQGGLLQGHPH